MISDPIGDMLTRIRNCNILKKESCLVPYSKYKEKILYLLRYEGYISKYRTVEERDGKYTIEVFLKYNAANKPVIHSISRVSKPSRRRYASYKNIPIVINGLGDVVVSTSKGLMSGERARAMKIGGELILEIW